MTVGCTGGSGGGGSGGNGGNSGSAASTLVGDRQNEKKKLAPVSITLVSFAVSRKAYTKVAACNPSALRNALSPSAGVTFAQCMSQSTQGHMGMQIIYATCNTHL